MFRFNLKKDITWVAVCCLMSLWSCGSDQGSGGQGQGGVPRAGRYALGDAVKYHYTRVGYQPAEYDGYMQVVAIDAAKATLQFTDYFTGTQDLIKWSDESNPRTQVEDYNQEIQVNQSSRTYTYQPDEQIQVQTPAGTFTCVHIQYDWVQAGDRYQINECVTSQVAVTQQVFYENKQLDANGAVMKSWRRDLLANSKD